MTPQFNVPPSGGSLEIGNQESDPRLGTKLPVPPSGGSLEIGNKMQVALPYASSKMFPLRGDP